MIKKLVGLAALGGFLYAHKKSGNANTLDGFKSTARGLLDDVKMRERDIRDQAEQKLKEERGAGDFGSASQTSGIADDVTGYGSAGYGYGSSDINRR